MLSTPGVTLRWFLYSGIFEYWFPANKQALKRIKAWIGWHFTGKVGLMTFLKKHFHIKLTSNGRKQDRTKNISLEVDTRKKKTKAESPDWRRAYICPSDRTEGRMRNLLGYRGTP